MFENILLAVDGSDHSMRAAKQAGDLARTLHSTIVRIIVAFEPIPDYLGEPNRQQAIDARMDKANAILQQAQAAVGGIPGEIHTELIEGSPAEAIINVARTRKSTVIIMGSRGLSNMAELVLGSTSHNVVSHAPCPVLIVR
ncbi:MAG: universal stress protein [Bacteroidota bacterium]